MIPAPTIRPRQQKCECWSMDHLVHKQALTKGETIDISTKKSYGSTLNSYINFILLHNLPAEPTPDTLSLFIVYTTHYIKLDSMDSYLSGIAHQLKPFFPDVHKACSSPLVKRTLHSCKHMHGTLISHKRALSLDNLTCVINYYVHSSCHNDLLFVVMLLTGFFTLMCLCELSLPDDKSIQDWCKVMKRSTVALHPDSYEFHLPHHKADPFFEGNHVIVC